MARPVGRHLSAETLAAHVCEELSRLDSWRLRGHLAGCEVCRERKEDLEGPLANGMLTAYRDATSIDPDVLPQAPREAFADWLAAQPVPRDALQPTRVHQPEGPHPARLRRFETLFSLWPSDLHRSSAGAAALAILLAGGVWLPWWSRKSAPQLSPDALLVRAEKRDARENAAASGAIRQTVLIKAGPQALKRSLYWDPKGKREARRVDWTQDHDPLGSASAAAGLDWHRPLSASAYEAWREHQQLGEESITRSAHLLTLTTTVQDGLVASESLTLRESDFHAVARTVDVRGRGTVEIAEVDYTVLPWTDVPPTAFEPLAPLAGIPDVALATPRPSSSLHLPPDAGQLDATELAARLILNQLHADVGEQIEIRRTPQWVEVSGVIEEDERKRQLRAALSLVPRLKVSIVSAIEVQNAPPVSTATVAESSAALPDHPSALETYLAARGRDVTARNALAQQLFADTLSISQECKALAELDARFPPSGQMPVVESATLAELRYSHHERLTAALRRERLLLALLRDQRPDGPEGDAAPSSRVRSLTELGEDNLALTRELTQTNTPASRNAEVLFEEMAAGLGELDAASQWQATTSTENTARQNQGMQPR